RHGTSGPVVTHPKRTPRVVSVLAAQPAVHGDVRVGAYALEIGRIKRIKRERLGTVDAPFTHERVGGHDDEGARRTVPVKGMGRSIKGEHGAGALRDEMQVHWGLLRKEDAAEDDGDSRCK